MKEYFFTFEDWVEIFSEETDPKKQKQEYKEYLRHAKKCYRERQTRYKTK